MEERLTKTFGEVLRKRRLIAGFSQEALALEADLHRTYISLLERGLRQPSLTTIFVLANGLGCEPDEMILEVRKSI